jgi:hypothetical protein
MQASGEEQVVGGVLLVIVGEVTPFTRAAIGTGQGLNGKTA